MNGAQESQLALFASLVRRWNERVGLVSRGDVARLESRHIEESLELLPMLYESKRHLDIGSGGGFPGIPLAIAMPLLKVVLLDRSRNKCCFLRHAVMSLKLKNIEVVQRDVSEYSPCEKFDSVTARAVSSPRQIYEAAMPHIKESGLLLLQHAATVPLGFPSNEVHQQEKSLTGCITVIRKGRTD